MANTKQNPLVKTTGTVAGVTLYDRLGTSVLRDSRSERSPSLKPNLKQKRHTIQWADCTNLWKNIVTSGCKVDGAPLKSICCFARHAGQTHFNCFMSMNTVNVTAYLPKPLIREGCAMPFAGMMYSSGAAAPVLLAAADPPVVDEGGCVQVLTSLTIGDGPIGTADDLFDRIVRCNRGFHYDDTLYLLRCVVADAAKPCPAYSVVTLRRDATVALTDFANVGGRLALWVAPGSGIAVIHVEVGESVCHYSDSHLYLHPDRQECYATREAFDRAVASYGGAAEADFMAPDDTEQRLAGEFAGEG